jgi:DNA repair protein RecN (Recombination protein N)
MLQELRIKNLALLESLELALPEQGNGLIVLTGETGAGKSIILRALHLLAGGRGSVSWIRGECPQAEIEARFTVPLSQSEIKKILIDSELDCGDECLIRRVLNRRGRSRLFVNDKAVTTKLASRLAGELVSIAGQHDHQQLLQAKKHLDLLDTYGELWQKRQEFSRFFRQWHDLAAELLKLQTKEQEKEQRRDFLQYQQREIKEIAPLPEEDEALARERDLLKSSAALTSLSSESYSLIRSNIVPHLTTIRKNMEQAATLDKSVGKLAERIVASCYEIEDLAGELSAYHDGLPMDKYRLEEISARLGQLKQLQRKYGPPLEDVILYEQQIGEELAKLVDIEINIAKLAKEVGKAGEKVLAKGLALTNARNEAGRKLAASMAAELSSLHFPQAVFFVDMNSHSELEPGVQANGLDGVEFLFSANPGEEPKPLTKVASGGELSRLMLAMKCMLARRDKVETVVFDEVDAGIGGQAAEAVAAKISELAGHHQVLCITHLPQIAAHATTHYKVEKKIKDGRTTTVIKLLGKEERVAELARMLGGETVSEQTIAYARELAEKGCNTNSSGNING